MARHSATQPTATRKLIKKDRTWGVLAIILMVVLFATVNLIYLRLSAQESQYTGIVFSYNDTHEARSSGRVDFGLFVNNTGELAETFELTVERNDREGNLPAGWTHAFCKRTRNEDSKLCHGGEEVTSVTLQPGRQTAVSLALRTSSATGTFNLAVKVVAQHNPTSVDRAPLTVIVKSTFDDNSRVPEDAIDSQNVRVLYTGYTENGQVFDTTSSALAGNDSVHKHPTYSPNPDEAGRSFTVGGVVQGFGDALKGMQVGETNVAMFPPEEGYGESGHDLAGEWLVFEIQILEVL